MNPSTKHFSPHRDSQHYISCRRAAKLPSIFALSNSAQHKKEQHSKTRIPIVRRMKPRTCTSNWPRECTLLLRRSFLLNKCLMSRRHQMAQSSAPTLHALVQRMPKKVKTFPGAFDLKIMCFPTPRKFYKLAIAASNLALRNNAPVKLTMLLRSPEQPGTHATPRNKHHAKALRTATIVERASASNASISVDGSTPV